MRLRTRQLGFLLNPYRFAGTVQSGAMVANGGGTATGAGASVASATESMAGAATLTLVSNQAGNGAMSVTAAAVATLAGAGIAATPTNISGTGTASFAAASTALICDAADFDGANDWLLRSPSAFSSSPSSTKTGTLSLWFKFDTLPAGGTGNTAYILNSLVYPGIGPTGFQIYVSDDKALNFYAAEDILGTGSPQLTFFTTTNFVATGAWHHLAISWNAATSTSNIYYDGSSVSSFGVGGSPTFTDFNFDWSQESMWSVGADVTGAGKIDAGVAEMWISPGQYIDFSAAANLEKFRSSGGKPVDLGATGGTPTGTAPLIYLHLDDGETANNFAINRTSKGNFTVTGTLSTYASSPSD